MQYQYTPDVELIPPATVTNTVPMVGAPAPSADSLPPTGFNPQPAIAVAFLLIFTGAVWLYKVKAAKRVYSQRFKDGK